MHPGSPFWDDKDLLDTSPMVKDGTFPYWQDGLQTTTYIDDEYTYVTNLGKPSKESIIAVQSEDKKIFLGGLF